MEMKQNETKTPKKLNYQLGYWDAQPFAPTSEGTRKNMQIKISIWQKHLLQIYQQVANAKLYIVDRADSIP